MKKVLIQNALNQHFFLFNAGFTLKPKDTNPQTADPKYAARNF